MAELDKYINCEFSNISISQLLKLTISTDENGKPFFKTNYSANYLPAPPYAIFSENGLNVLETISELNYKQGLGPSNDSFDFILLASGLLPTSGNITISLDSNFSNSFEIYNPSTGLYTDSNFTISYISGEKNLPGFKVRIKSNLTAENYSGTITITAPNTLPSIINVTGTVLVSQFIVAIGGTITELGNRRIHRFTGDGTFQITQIADNSILNQIRRRIQAGGGGGGGSNGGACGGGGGGGGQIEDIIQATISTDVVTVGAGGAGGFDDMNGSNGSDSSINSTTAIGGGYGATQSLNMGPGGNGGCGGGGSFGSNGGTGTMLQGNRGGNSSVISFRPAGGGGGTETQGADVVLIGQGGGGGNGLESDIMGVLTRRGGGGGGSAYGTPGLGGLGGGGDATIGVIGDNGDVNTGGGGGGVQDDINNTDGGNGGSGEVVYSYIFM